MQRIRPKQNGSLKWPKNACHADLRVRRYCSHCKRKHLPQGTAAAHINLPERAKVINANGSPPRRAAAGKPSVLSAQAQKCIQQ
ncbi:MAG: hypothetical protein DWI63_02830 [Chloroflexi bacterium]|nr:MAG: hypothetical protein DWI63_02830 [Chloroflexota bacterium]